MTVGDLIRSFRITTKYKGYFITIEAIQYAVDNYGDFIRITKDIYPILAKKHNMKITAVERNIRTVVIACWNNNKILLESIMGCKLTTYPSNSEFVYSMAYYLVNKKYYIYK